MSDLTYPIATYQRGEDYYSCTIIDNYLYLGRYYRLHILEVTPSLTNPLIPVKFIKTKD